MLSLERIALALTCTPLATATPNLGITDPQIIIVSHLTILTTKILPDDIFG
ncbi:MAG: hypothetical protein V7K43_11920 [Nostoc sp.]